MKLYPLSFLFVLLAISACQNDPAGNSPASADKTEAVQRFASIPDSLVPQKTADIDVYVEGIDQEIRNNGKIEKKNPNWFSEKDRIGTFEKDGQYLRITTSLLPPDMETRTYYYFDGSQLVYMKHLEWHMNAAPPFAKEINAYLQGEQIFNILERSVVLEPGQKPGPLFAEPLRESNLRKDSLQQVIKADIDKILAFYSK